MFTSPDMSDYLAVRIRKRRFFKLNSTLPKNTKERYVIGFDSEADTSSQGDPMLFQFSLPETEEEETIVKVVGTEEHAGLRVFLDFLNEHCREREYAYLIYVWNLAYELTQIFHDIPSQVRSEDHFFIEMDNPDYPWKIEVVNYKRPLVRFTHGRITVTLLDGRAFYMTSLDKAAKMLGLGEKYVMTAGHDRSLFTRADLDNEEFLLYSKRDAYITRLIGEYIARQHDLFKIPTTVSAPQFAATIFKTHFLKGDLSKLHPDCEQAGLSSYHGGKNGFYLDGPTDFPDIWNYDITSAYPEAMRQLPSIDDFRWRNIYEYMPGDHAIVRVSGKYRRCKYRGMQNHDGTWTYEGEVYQTWITSYELDAMIEHGEFDLKEINGYRMVGSVGGGLTEYVDRFFGIKVSTTGPERETAKLLLNSLYGKFFQKQPVGIVGRYDLDNRQWIKSDPSSDYDYEAGGLYYPPIASLITGFVRARIHRLEHKYEAVMTSTDGLFGFVPPDPGDLGSKLGELKATRGRLRIWRERLYIFDGIDGETKYALHGFRGNKSDLEKIPLEHGVYRYAGKQMITLKMSNNKQAGEFYKPGTFIELPYVINI